ncbi:histidine kinase, partial [Streptomyces sp. NPDC058424]
RLESDGSITVGRKTWDVDHLGLPDQHIELRVFAGGHFHGRFLLRPTPGHTPPLEARLVAVTLADQAGAALQALWMETAPRP